MSKINQYKVAVILNDLDTGEEEYPTFISTSLSLEETISIIEKAGIVLEYAKGYYNDDDGEEMSEDFYGDYEERISSEICADAIEYLSNDGFNILPLLDLAKLLVNNGGGHFEYSDMGITFDAEVVIDC